MGVSQTKAFVCTSPVESGLLLSGREMSIFNNRGVNLTSIHWLGLHYKHRGAPKPACSQSMRLTACSQSMRLSKLVRTDRSSYYGR